MDSTKRKLENERQAADLNAAYARHNGRNGPEAGRQEELLRDARAWARAELKKLLPVARDLQDLKEQIVKRTWDDHNRTHRHYADFKLGYREFTSALWAEGWPSLEDLAIEAIQEREVSSADETDAGNRSAGESQAAAGGESDAAKIMGDFRRLLGMKAADSDNRGFRLTVQIFPSLLSFVPEKLGWAVEEIVDEHDGIIREAVIEALNCLRLAGHDQSSLNSVFDAVAEMGAELFKEALDRMGWIGDNNPPEAYDEAANALYQDAIEFVIWKYESLAAEIPGVSPTCEPSRVEALRREWLQIREEAKRGVHELSGQIKEAATGWQHPGTPANSGGSEPNTAASEPRDVAPRADDQSAGDKPAEVLTDTGLIDAGRAASAHSGIPQGAIPLVPPLRNDIEKFAEDAFAITGERTANEHAEKRRQALTQARRTGNSGAYLPALIQCAVDQVRDMILARADAYVDAFTTFGVPSDAKAEESLKTASQQIAGGAVAAVCGELELRKRRTRVPQKGLGNLNGRVEAARKSALQEAVLRLKRQRITAGRSGISSQQADNRSTSSSLAETDAGMTGAGGLLANEAHDRPGRRDLLEKLSADDPNYEILKRFHHEAWADSFGLLAGGFAGTASPSDYVDGCVNTFDQAARAHLDFQDATSIPAICRELDVMVKESTRLLKESLAGQLERLGEAESDAAIDEYARRVNEIAARTKQEIHERSLAEFASKKPVSGHADAVPENGPAGPAGKAKRGAEHIPTTTRRQTPVSRQEKGDLALLQSNGQRKRVVTMDVARRFGGVSLRAIQDAARKRKLITEGKHSQRRVLVDSLLKYFPPEK